MDYNTYAWTNGGQGVLEAIGTDKAFTNKYASNGCPDQSANGMFSYCKKKGMDWGVIGTLPEIVGLALFTDGHIGYYVGGGYAVEWRGFNYGCVKTCVKDRTWKHWAKLPFIDYGVGAATQPAVDAPAAEYTLGSRLLKKGMTGSDVKTLQELLNQLHIVSPALEVDGDFGGKTDAAVRAFQKKLRLKQDGLYGEDTHKALMGAVADDDEGKKVQEQHVENQSEEEKPVDGVAAPMVTIVCGDGTVNIRVGNSTGFARITAVKNGTRFPYIATAANGWHAVLLDSQIGWVSGKYSKVG